MNSIHFSLGVENMSVLIEFSVTSVTIRHVTKYKYFIQIEGSQGIFLRLNMYIRTGMQQRSYMSISYSYETSRPYKDNVY